MWDGKAADVLEHTVVQSGRRNAEGLEEAELHWKGKAGKGKGKKGKGGVVMIWKCVVVEGEQPSAAK